jgi:putative peptide zinc metalloprotease protein
MRPDLVVERQTYQGRLYYLVKDPIGLKYYRFEEEEYAILEMLSGNVSLDQIQEQFEARFAPQQITVAELHQLVGRLYQSALLVSSAPGQGKQLVARGRERRRRQVASTFTNLLSLRMRGVDPDRFLTWLNRRLGWIFSPAAALAFFALAAAALALVGVEFESFRARLPAFQEFFAARNWFWIALTLACTKVLHELGHGLACKRFGGACHEMGVMFLVFTPCLYCNVSDSWMLPSKWRRAAIGAAGMYVELMLASAATFLWWFSQPGVLNYLCLNVMFVCSVTTLLFNANPFLRCDGYYILSDLLEIPNLRQKATTSLQRKLAAWCLGIPEPHDPFLPARRRFVLALYAVAAAAYRWLITLSIFWFLYRVLEPYGFKIVGQALACGMIWGLVIVPLWQLYKFFQVPGRTDKVNTTRLAASFALLAAILLIVLFLPLPHYVTCGLRVEPREAEAVYVSVPGAVSEVHVRAGDIVSAGEPLLSLTNSDLELGVLRLAGERDQLATRLASLRRRAFLDETAGLEIGQVEEAVASLDEQLARRRRELNRLRITASAAGTILPPPETPERPRDAVQLAAWSGRPLEAKNRGAFLSSGVLVCHVGDPRKLSAALAIDQSEIEFVRSGQAAELFLEQYPGRVFRGQIDQVAQIDMKVAPRNLSSKAGGEVATRTDAAGHERPASATYQASVPLDDPTAAIPLGASGRAKIHVGYQTVGAKLWRAFCATFSFQM